MHFLILDSDFTHFTFAITGNSGLKKTVKVEGEDKGQAHPFLIDLPIKANPIQRKLMIVLILDTKLAQEFVNRQKHQ